MNFGTHQFVIPAQAGIQPLPRTVDRYQLGLLRGLRSAMLFRLDSRLRGNDGGVYPLRALVR